MGAPRWKALPGPRRYSSRAISSCTSGYGESSFKHPYRGKFLFVQTHLCCRAHEKSKIIFLGLFFWDVFTSSCPTNEIRVLLSSTGTIGRVQYCISLTIDEAKFTGRRQFVHVSVWYLSIVDISFTGSSSCYILHRFLISAKTVAVTRPQGKVFVGHFAQTSGFAGKKHSFCR